jgi:hypothetical protein
LEGLVVMMVMVAITLSFPVVVVVQKVFKEKGPLGMGAIRWGWT